MIVSVIYQLAPDQKFDLGYYMNTHIPMVADRFGGFGLKGTTVLHGTGSPAGPAQAEVIALLEFGSMQDFQAAVSAHGAEVMGDIANFTDCQPALQFNEKLA